MAVKPDAPSPLTRFLSAVTEYEQATGLRCALVLLGETAYRELLTDVAVKQYLTFKQQTEHAFVAGVMVKSYGR